MAQRTTVDFQETAIKALVLTAGDAGVIRAIAASHRALLAVSEEERALAEHNFTTLMHAIERVYGGISAISRPHHSSLVSAIT
jgi:hypothetical protein